MAEKPILVKAVHSYTPVNNDELKLDKGDILTVARKEEGGWWEGTLPNGKTGWFPSNYVEDLPVLPSSPAGPAATVTSPSPLPSVKKSPQHQQESFPLSPSNSFVDSSAFAAQQAEYRQVAFNELMESESTHLSELQAFWETYMVPLQKADLLSTGEFKVLTGNLPELINVHVNSLLNLLKAEQNKPLKEQCIGSIFLENAPKIETVQKTYCSNHPKAVQVVEKHKEELGSFIESKGGRKPGILHIITCLSQTFRRLEKYPTLLQEIERHVEEFHKDRGDLQRSIEYYKEIQKTCSALRKQKEMELEVLSGSIKGWEGADVCQLGDIIFMNLVHLGYERQARYFVLFPNTLLILSYNTESNSLVYEGKVPVSGITLKPLIDKDTLTNAFEIAGPMIDQIIVSCTSKAIRETWLGHLNSILKSNRFPSFSSSPQQSFGQLTPPVQAWNIARLRPAPPFNPFLAEYLASVKKQRQAQRHESSPSSLNQSQQNLKNGGGMGGRAPGISSTASITSFSSSYNHSPAVTNEDDFAVLSIVDSFCTKNRHTVSTASVSMSSLESNNPGLISGQPQPPRTLAQLVMLLRDEIAALRMTMEDEQRKRIALQILVQKHLGNQVGSTNGNNIINSNNNGTNINESSSSLLSLTSTPDH